MKQIHFVCYGNVYRSRMAEAYFNSRQISDWTASSSGVHAAEMEIAIAPSAVEVLTENGIFRYASPMWTRSTKEMLETADVVVFLHNIVYEKCLDELAPALQKFYVWSVEDAYPSMMTKEQVEIAAHKAFSEIVDNVNKLLETL